MLHLIEKRLTEVRERTRIEMEIGNPKDRFLVVPAQAGTQGFQSLALGGPRFRGGDEWGWSAIRLQPLSPGRRTKRRSWDKFASSELANSKLSEFPLVLLECR
jgi:hypothetical protein